MKKAGPLRLLAPWRFSKKIHLTARARRREEGTILNTSVKLSVRWSGSVKELPPYAFAKATAFRYPKPQTPHPKPDNSCSPT